MGGLPDTIVIRKENYGYSDITESSSIKQSDVVHAIEKSPTYRNHPKNRDGVPTVSASSPSPSYCERKKEGSHRGGLAGGLTPGRDASPRRSRYYNVKSLTSTPRVQE